MNRPGRLAISVAIALLVIRLAAPFQLAAFSSALARAACETTLPTPGPSQVLTASAEAEIDALLADMPVEVKIGQMLMAGVTGTTADDDARAMIDDLHIGNVILMGRNIDDPAQV